MNASSQVLITEGLRHEITDRIHVLQVMLDQVIASHPAATELISEIAEAQEAIFKLYQAAGDRLFQDPSEVSTVDSTCDTIAVTPESRFIELLSKNSGIPVESISLESHFVDLGIDSLDIVEFVMALEDEFRVEIPDPDYVGVKTVNQLQAVLLKALNTKSGFQEVPLVP